MPQATPSLADPVLAQAETIRKVRAEALRQGVDADLAMAVARRESAFNPQAESKAGAQGVMQLMPGTAQQMGVSNPFDADENIRGGIGYLKRQLEIHKDKPPHVARRLALAGYNAGPGAVARYGGVPPYKETMQYADALAPLPAVPTDPIVAQAEQIRAQLKGQTPAGGPPGLPPEALGIAPPTLPGGAPSPIPDPRLNDPGMVQSGLTRLAIGVGESFDPTTPQGRRTLAGTGGALAAGALTGGLGTIPGVAAMMVGAGAGGALAETGEQMAAGGPPQLGRIAGAGAEQAAYEGLGHGLLWPLRAAGRRLVASSVSRNAVEGLSKAKEATVAKLEGALTAVSRMLPGGPPKAPAAAGRAAAQVLEGPAQNARDRAGAAVAEAARSGPPVNIRDLKTEARRIFDEELRPAAEAFPRQAAEDAAEEAVSVGGRKLNVGDLGGMSPAAREAIQAAMADAHKEAVKEKLKAPSMQVIQRILNAEDEVSFEAAHLFKRELDDALLGTADKVEKKRVTSITQHLRGGLRTALSSHAPYNEATDAYRQIIPLYTKGLAKDLQRLATENPEVVVNRIRVKEPTKVGMLREVLTTQAEEGGGGRVGQAAWDSVRSAWTHQNVIRGHIDGLGKRLDRLTPEFTQEMYGDSAGTTVLQNLRAIDTAYQQAAAKTTTQEGRFLASSLAPRRVSKIEEVGADIARAGALGPFSFWGGVSLMRLLRGPKSADLLEWAAYSPTHTQMLVHALTSPVPGHVMGAILRGAGFPPLASHGQPPQSPAGGPPPRPSLTGPPRP